MTKTKRSTLMAVLLMVLCMAMFAAGTYALFTDEVGLKNHLEAGKLDITLERTHLSTWQLDNTTGLFVEKNNDSVVDFSQASKRNVFDLTEVDRIVPLCTYTAQMKISNNSDVAFRYWLEIVFDDSENKAIADQLYVTVDTVKGRTEGKLSEITSLIGSEKEPISTVTIESEKNFETFTVSIKFLDLEDNNDASSQTVDFDVKVHAVQVIPEENP